MASGASGSRKRPRGTDSSSSRTERGSTPPTSPDPVRTLPPAGSSPVMIRGIPSGDAPLESDFVSAQALSRYRSSAPRGFTTERGWRLQDFGPIPILIDGVPIPDWVDWQECLTSTGYEPLVRYHCSYVATLVREFFANASVLPDEQGGERVTSVVRGRPVDLTAHWLSETHSIPRPHIDSQPPPDAQVFEDVLLPYCPRTITEIPVGGVRLPYLPLVRSITANFRPGTHSTELDLGDLLLLYHLRHRIPIDVPSIMMRFIVDACTGRHAFPFPGTITRAIQQAGIVTDHFTPGHLRTKGPITETSFRQSIRHIRIVGDVPPPADVPPPPEPVDTDSTQPAEPEGSRPTTAFLEQLADQIQEVLAGQVRLAAQQDRIEAQQAATHTLLRRMDLRLTAMEERFPPAPPADDEEEE